MSSGMIFLYGWGWYPCIECIAQLLEGAWSQLNVGFQITYNVGFQITYYKVGTIF
jgi:hypothetical protein